MRIDEKEPWVWWLDWRVGVVAAAVVISLLLFAFVRLGPSSGGSSGPAPDALRPEDDALEQARQSLVEESDLNSCRAALQQINTHISQPGAARAPAAPAEQLAALRQQLGLDAAAFEEIAATSFSLLDAHHLTYCLLMRDAARSLDVQSGSRTGGDERAPLDKATAAFDWVVRQVRPPDRRAADGPPDWVLRRGRGTEMDRALAFLGLLPQLNGPDGRPAGLAGALVFCPAKDPKQMRLWACGVVLPGGKDLYLFDPRLGLAVPGPGGKGVATLAQARQGDVLRQLDASGGPAYDVTAEQAKAANIQLFYPISALAPRQRYLQDQVLPPVVEVRLAADLRGDLERVKAAAAAGADKPPEVGVWKLGLMRWREFLVPDEGGTAKPEPFALRNLFGFTDPRDETVVRMTPQMYFTYDLVPWQHFPKEFRSNIDMPYNIGLGQRVREIFSRPWFEGVLAGGGSRDLLLRGRFPQAAKLLVAEQEKRRDQQRQSDEAGDLTARLNEWIAEANRAYANQLRRAKGGSPQEQEEAAKAVEELWGIEKVEPVFLLLTGALARPRGAEVTIQLGLCKQEQAERMQARLDLLSRGGAKPSAADLRKLQDAWRDALGWWNDFDAHYPKATDKEAEVNLDRDRATVRRLRGRAEQALGEAQAALKDWQDVSGPMSEPEKVALLYCARRLSAGQHK
jgi:hypothetical protein